MFSFGLMLAFAMLVTCLDGREIFGKEKSLKQDDERKTYVDPLSDVVCGLRPMELKTGNNRGNTDRKPTLESQQFNRIVGGSEAVIGFYPWQVRIVVMLNASSEMNGLCGGTILSEYWILSAAHCFPNSSEENVTVYIGDHNTTYKEDSEQMFKVEHLIKHRLYNGDTTDYDIALLKIKPVNRTGIMFGSRVQPACLPDRTTSYVVEQKCHVSGWGLTDPRNNASLPVVLQSAKVSIIDDESCQRFWNYTLTPRMVCAGYLEGGIGTCQGDSGGPLVCDINSRYTVMGATSFGGKLCGLVSVFARVTEFLSWIKATVKEYTAVCWPPEDAPKIRGPKESYAPGEIIESDQFVCPANHTLIPRNGMICLQEGWTETAKCIPNDERKTYVDPFSDVVCGIIPMKLSRTKNHEITKRELTSKSQQFDRIVGGSNAAFGFYPWQVGIRPRNVSDGSNLPTCGGTILSEYWILSAADCFTIWLKENVTVHIGDHDVLVHDKFEQEFELEHLIKHSQYNVITNDYNIALLKIKPKNGTGIKFGSHVQPACLPDQSSCYVGGQTCHVSGWGYNMTDKSLPYKLQSATVYIVNDETCQRLMNTFTPRMVCAGYLYDGIDICKGDSGGPLVCDIKRRYTVMGVTSFNGRVCGRAPGVYARVTEFLPWIKSTVKEYTERSTEESTDPSSNNEILKSPHSEKTASPHSQEEDRKRAWLIRQVIQDVYL